METEEEKTPGMLFTFLFCDFLGRLCSRAGRLTPDHPGSGSEVCTGVTDKEKTCLMSDLRSGFVLPKASPGPGERR